MTDENDSRNGEKGDAYRLLTLGEAALQVVTENADPEPILTAGKPFGVLVYLACAPGQSATREHLIDLLWANLELDSARHALRQALWYLRKQTGRHAIRSSDEEVVLSVPLTFDRDEFLQAIERQDHERAAELYEGDFLPMFAAPGGASFEKWADTERYRLRTHFLQAVQAAVKKKIDEGRFERARELALQARDRAPRSQRTWRLLLETLLQAGDRVRARIEAHALERRREDFPRPLEEPLRRLLRAARDEGEPGAGRPDERTLEPELIGRESEFAAILSAREETEAGQGRHVHLSGRAGLGKSRLLAEVESRLESMGRRVVALRAQPGDRDLPFTLAATLAAALAEYPGGRDVTDGVASVLVALNPDLTDLYPVTPDSARAEEALRRRTVALHALLAEVASAEPLTVLIDDLHWADDGSCRLLGGLTGRIADLPVLLVTASRPGSGAGELITSATRRLSLSPHAEAEIARLLASLGTLPDAAWAEALPADLKSATGGVPLLVIETLRLALDDGVLALEDGVWKTVDPEELRRQVIRGQALRRRIEDLPPDGWRALLLLALGGRPLSSHLIRNALGEAQDTDRDRTLQTLEVQGMVSRRNGGWRISHDELAAATLDMADGGELRDLHRAIGRALTAKAGGGPDRPFRAGRHFLEAGDIDRLQGAFSRWLATLRAQGDPRPADELAAAFLGEETDADLAERLLRSVPLRIRLRPTVLRTLGAAALTVLIVLSLGLWSWSRSSPDPEASLYVFRSSDDAGIRGYEVPLSRTRLQGGDAVGVEGEGEAVPELSGLQTWHPVLPGPEGERWAYVRTVPDSGDWEAYLVSENGSRRRLTFAPGDDIPMSWSPDGRFLILETSRWQRYGWHSLAVLELASGEIRRLTHSRHDDHDAVWSPVGPRIVFRRELRPAVPDGAVPDPPRRLCSIHFDGTGERCLSAPARSFNLLGPAGPSSVFTLVGGDDRAKQLARVDLRTGEVEVVDEAARTAFVSPDGEWIARLRERSGQERRWYVNPVGEREAATLVTGVPAGEAPPTWRLSWSYSRERRAPLDRVRILAPDTLPVRVPVQLRSEGFTKSGEPVRLSSLRWSTSTPERAAVDSSSGLILPLREGRIGVVASAGGWRADTIMLDVDRPTFRLRLEEDWSDPLAEEWVPFGTPRPSMVRNPELGPALYVRGDGTFQTGVYTREQFQATGGLGVRVTVSTARTAPAEQSLSIALSPWTRPRAVERWDHRTGALPLDPGSCSARYPAGDGMHTSDALTTSSGQAVVDRDLASGVPYTLTLQIFPDGTCGIAVNGRPLARSAPVSAKPTRPHRVVLQGKSVDTRMLVGSVEVWLGIRSHVDWSSLSGWSPREATDGRSAATDLSGGHVSTERAREPR